MIWTTLDREHNYKDNHTYIRHLKALKACSYPYWTFIKKAKAAKTPDQKEKQITLKNDHIVFPHEGRISLQLLRAFSRIKMTVFFKAGNMLSLSRVYLRDHSGKHYWGGVQLYINESKHHMHNCSNALHSFTKHQICTYSNILVKEHITYNDNSDKVMETIALLWKQHLTKQSHHKVAVQEIVTISLTLKCSLVFSPSCSEE